MSQTSTTTICLSYEELLYLLRAMGLPNLPGMDLPPWKELTEDQAAVMLESIGRSLASRGLVGPGQENSLVIDPALEAILHACARPEQVLSMTFQSGEQRGQDWYYKVNEFAIHQSMILPWVYRFELNEETDWGWETIAKMIDQAPADEQEAVFTLENDLFETFSQQAAQDGEAAAHSLVDHGVDLEVARQLVRAVASAGIRLRVQYTDMTSEQMKQDALIFLATGETAWVLNSLTATLQIAVARLPKARVRQVFQAALAQLN